jgi:hypothetical protein
MKKQHQGVRSTRVLEDPEMKIPAIPKARDVYIKVHNATETMHTDQTGQFPATSSKGNQNIMVLVEVDGNFINAEPMKNKSEGAMIKAYQTLWTQPTASGMAKLKPTYLTMKLLKNSRRKFKKIVRFN